jgi:hypothetical protein
VFVHPFALNARLRAALAYSRSASSIDHQGSTMADARFRIAKERIGTCDSGKRGFQPPSGAEPTTIDASSAKVRTKK